MKASKKVGVVAVSNNNYGSQLQTFAMHYALCTIGVENEVIRYKQSRIKQLKRVLNPSFLTIKGKALARSVLCKVRYPEISRGFSTRNAEFERFKSQYIKYSPLITSREVLEEFTPSYAGIVLGSDQVWHPANLEMDYFTLSFIPRNIPKVTYAPSFGVSEIPKDQIEITRSYLERIDSISVREVRGAEIVKALTGKVAPIVCDPTALLTKSDWDRIKRPNEYSNEKYIFCYFLGANPSHRTFVERIKELTGYKIIALQHLDEFIKGDLSFGDIKPYKVGPDDFISLIADAQIVLTDSFHGTLFSIYYHKDFFTFSRFGGNQKASTNSRIASILERLGIKDRWLTATEDPSECLSKTIKWERVDNGLSEFRESSLVYLKKAVSGFGLRCEGLTSNNIGDKEKKLCTGCTACVTVCPVSAISMEADDEGFRYPFVDEKLCIKCGLCLRTCPVNKDSEESEISIAFASRIEKPEIRSSSSAGGMFTALAEKTIEDGGAVVGTAFNDNMILEHNIVEKIEDIAPLRASKYVQSDLLDVFKRINDLLVAGRKVLFCGTPCQSAGLYACLGENYENLVLVDVVCYGVPSPGVFRDFIEYLGHKHNSKVSTFKFRDKTYGYASPNVKAVFRNGETEEMTHDVKSFTNLFFKGVIARPSCANCSFKGPNRITDLTLGDYWEVGKRASNMDDDTGATLILVHTKKGLHFLSKLSDVMLKEVNFDTAVEDCGPMLFKSAPTSARRYGFFKAYRTIPYIECVNRYAPESIKNKIANIIKPVLLKTGITRFGVLKAVKSQKIKHER